jgi:hypothetical protein
MVRKTQILEGFFYLEGGSVRNYKTDREKVLNGHKWKPGCMGLQAICHMEKIFTIKINCVDLMFFVSPTVWRFWKRYANRLDFGGLGWFLTHFVDWKLRVQNRDNFSGQFQWNLRSETEMIPMIPSLRLRGGPYPIGQVYEKVENSYC